MTYTKLFSSITESTIWMENNETRLVWICMMAMADKYGRVFGSIPGLANRARVSLPDAEAALNKFLAPDTYSRTPANEGRRILPIEGGWRLLNHGYYRNLQDTESQKAYKAAWAREKRKRTRDAKRLGVDRSVDNVDKKSIGVDDIAEASPYAAPKAYHLNTPPTTTEIGPSIDEVVAYATGPHGGSAQITAQNFWNNFAGVGWIDAAGRKIINWRAAFHKWKTQQGNHAQRDNNQTNRSSSRSAGENITDRRRIKGDECRDEGITIPVIRVEPKPQGMVPGTG